MKLEKQDEASWSIWKSCCSVLIWSGLKLKLARLAELVSNRLKVGSQTHISVGTWLEITRSRGITGMDGSGSLPPVSWHWQNSCFLANWIQDIEPQSHGNRWLWSTIVSVGFSQVADHSEGPPEPEVWPVTRSFEIWEYRFPCSSYNPISKCVPTK